MQKKRIFILLQFFMVLQLYSLNSPVLHCVSVNTNGKISLDWLAPTDVNGFNSYHIFRSNSALGPFIKIDSINNINQLNYNDLNVNATIQTYYYYIICKSNQNTLSQPSDTLQSILLTVTNTGTGIASLNWNPIRIPLLSSSSNKYLIFRKNGSLNLWTKIDSTLNLNYNDTINVCHDTVYYRVEIEDFSGCKSVSSIDKKLFEDVIAPISNGIDTVSVDIVTGKVKIGWQPSPSNDVMGYIICHGSPCIALDTVWGKLSSSYTDVLFDPCNSAQGYRIAAFDTCFNTSLFSNIHNTIHLTSNYSKCENKITLNWTPYINMNPTINGYKVLMSKNGNPYNTIATLSNNSLNYSIDNLDDSTTYCFYIQAFETTTNKTSSSCIKCYSIIKSLNPTVLYIRSVSVTGENQIEVKIYTDPTNYIQGYQLLRSTNSSGVYSQIATIPFTNLANFSYNDFKVNTSSNVYYYKTTSIDSCGNTGITSNTAHSILLQGKTYDSYTNELNWSDYGDWAGNIDGYYVYRAVNGIFNTNPIALISSSIPGAVYQYLDDVKDFISGNGKFNYFIQAKEQSNSIYNFVEQSNSNIIEIVQQPEMYIPNAFSPEGINKIFKPVAIFLSNENYFFQIYNRFGQMIFETNNPEVGWDGKYLNEFVKQGVYFYLLHYSLPNHTIIQKKGSVTVIL